MGVKPGRTRVSVTLLVAGKLSFYGSVIIAVDFAFLSSWVEVFECRPHTVHFFPYPIALSTRLGSQHLNNICCVLVTFQQGHLTHWAQESGLGLQYFQGQMKIS